MGLQQAPRMSSEPAKCKDDEEAKAYIKKMKEWQEILKCYEDGGVSGQTTPPAQNTCPPKPVLTEDDEKWMKKLKMFGEERTILQLQQAPRMSSEPAKCKDDGEAKAYIKKMKEWQEIL